ncbi:ATP-binding cassette domain-containing protein, partial [Proteus myxofaciens]|uniref:ATP-binding cassette domain-containing protein n=1 Tax=Proteus myxofaciens TaxID=184072 RepID=UPI000A8EBBCF
SILTLNSISLHHKENHEILVHDLSLDIQKGRTLAIVGESGSGKSLISKAIMGLLPSSVTLTGDIYFEDNLISQYKATER